MDTTEQKILELIEDEKRIRGNRERYRMNESREDKAAYQEQQRILDRLERLLEEHL